MQLLSFRHAIAVCAILTLLTGCGGLQLQPGIPAVTAQQSARSGDPCVIAEEWYFKGSCVEERLSKTETTFNLKKYKGISTSLGLSSKEKSQARTKVVVGDATGPSDIIGKVNGRNFPFYNSKDARCYSWLGRKFARCQGKAFLYVIASNRSARTLVFTEFPSSTITDQALPNGQRCFLVELIKGAYSNSFWNMLPTGAKVANGKLSIVHGLRVGGDVAIEPYSALILGYSCL